jgi:acyl dehydratase
MSASLTPKLLFGDLKVGDRLPALEHKVSATTVVLGALASRDWRPMHHDKDFAIERNGTRDIFINTPNNAAWFERYITDWTGPFGRLGRLGFQMKTPVFPGDEMCFGGEVKALTTDDTGCHWVDLELTIGVDEEPRTVGKARVAVPGTVDDNPWRRKGERWQP